jgi:hypothetical protein
MTRKLSLIVAVAGLALLVAAPASGKGQAPTQQWEAALDARSQALNEQHGLGDGTVNYEQALRLRGEGMNEIHGLGGTSVVTSERATRNDTSAYQTALALRSQELNRQHELGTFATPYMDAGERAIRVNGTETPIVPDAFERAASSNRSPDGFVAGDDFVRIDPADLPTVVVEATPSSTGTEVQWPQIGIGFLIGLLLTIGIALTIRFNRQTPLAH